jgi:phosphate transport system substrate-binding protein
VVPPSSAPVAISPVPAAVAPTTPAVTSATPAVVSPSVSTTKPGMIAQAPISDAGGAKTGIPPWLWLLSLPLLGGLIWALLKGLGGSEDVVEAASPRSGAVSTAAIASAAAADRAGDNSRIILTPRSAREAYVYWEVPEAHKLRLRKEEGGSKLSLRLYDVTGLEFDRHPAHSIQEFECDESDRDLHFPVPQTDRDYLVELGYVTFQGRWVKLAQSNAVHIAADGTPGTPRPASAPPLPMLPNFPGAETATETGIKSSFRDGMPLVEPVAPTDSLPANLAAVDLNANLDMADSTQTLEQSDFRELNSRLTVPVEAAAPKSRVKRSQIVLSPRSSHDADATWEVLEHHKEIAKQHGGQNFILRICDVTGVDLESQAPHSIQQFNCEESDTSRTVTVPDHGEYVAEIGYLAKNGRWLRIARSAPVYVPAVN